jgi:hypothetical protein
MSNDEDTGTLPASGVVTHFSRNSLLFDNKQHADLKYVVYFLQ